MGQGHVRRLLENLNDDTKVRAGLEAVRKANSAAYEEALRTLKASQTSSDNKRR